MVPVEMRSTCKMRLPPKNKLCQADTASKAASCEAASQDLTASQYDAALLKDEFTSQDEAT